MKRMITALLAAGVLLTLSLPAGAENERPEQGIPDDLTAEYQLTPAGDFREEFRELATMEKEFLWIGKEPAGSCLFLWVYTLSPEGERIVWYFEETTVEASGFCELTIPLPYIGNQYVLLLTADPGEGELLCRKAVHWSCSRRGRTVEEELRKPFNIYQLLEAS